MALVRDTDRLKPKSVFDAEQREKARARKDAEDEVASLSDDDYEKYRIVRYCAKTFEAAQKARKPHETYDIAWSLYNGDMWNDRRPPWRATITINKIRAFITFIQAIMTDNKPRFFVEPRVQGTDDAADLLNKLVDRDWDENDMQDELSLLVLYGLIWGYAFIKITYDPYANGGRGKHLATVIPPYRIYTNRTAKGIGFDENCEYIIHEEDMTMGWIRRNFPDKYEVVKNLQGAPRREQGEDQIKNRDFVYEGTAASPRILSAMNVGGNIVSPQAPMQHPTYQDDDHDTVPIREFWLRDDTWEPYEAQVVQNGRGVFMPLVQDGEVVMEKAGTKTITSEVTGQQITIDNMQPKMVPLTTTKHRLKYPNGRLVVIAAGRVLLRDIPNPFQTDGFPFGMWKDYDVGGIHGQGEPLQLRSMAVAVNKIASQVFEILEKTGNPSWKLKKGGVNSFSIKNRPGLVIPMENINDLEPLEKPPIPREFFELYKLISDGMGEVCGVNEAVKGSLPAANAAFATMDQLQESGSAPIRQKVRNLEKCIRRIGKLRIALIQQYDRGDRPLRVEKDPTKEAQENEGGKIVEPPQNVGVEFRSYKPVDIQGQVEFGVVPISSLSTSPAGVWNRWMTLLDKKLIDPPWWHSKFRIEGWKTELPRMLKQQAQDAAKEAALKAASKAPTKTSARSAAQSRRAPPSNSPSRESNAMVR